MDESRSREPGAAKNQDEGAPAAPELSTGDRSKAEERTSVGAHVIHEAIRKEGEEELARPSSALAWSGLAAGLSMGFSLATQGLLRAHLPETAWRPLIEDLGYTVGFLIVVLGRQQLFTENTLTVILPLLARRNLSTLVNVARLWTVVLTTNLIGAVAFAWIVATTDVFEPAILDAFGEIGREAMAGDFWTILLRGVFAGWLIGLMVWLLPGAETARVPIIVLLTYVVALGGFAHIIAGSVDVLYLVTDGEVSFRAYAGGYMLPTLLGNILGGVSLVSALNHAQVVAGNQKRHGARLEGAGG